MAIKKIRDNIGDTSYNESNVKLMIDIQMLIFAFEGNSRQFSFLPPLLGAVAFVFLCSVCFLALVLTCRMFSNNITISCCRRAPYGVEHTVSVFNNSNELNRNLLSALHSTYAFNRIYVLLIRCACCALVYTALK